MLYWRITKYNPIYRIDTGAYSKDEWTCYSDIGKYIDGKLFTLEQYLKVEDAYIQAVILFMKDLKLDSLKISCLEKNGIRIKKYILEDKTVFFNANFVHIEHIPF